MIYERKYDIIYPNIMDDQVSEEVLTNLAKLCGLDELTVKLWFEDRAYFSTLEVDTSDDREMAIMVKGYMLGRQSMLEKGEVDADSVPSPPLWEHREEFPISTRKLASLLNVSRSTISRISKALCFSLFERSRDEEGRYLTWDDAEQIWDVVRQGPPYFKGEGLCVELEQEEKKLYDDTH